MTKISNNTNKDIIINAKTQKREHGLNTHKHKCEVCKKVAWEINVPHERFYFEICLSDIMLRYFQHIQVCGVRRGIIG